MMPSTGRSSRRSTICILVFSYGTDQAAIEGGVCNRIYDGVRKSAQCPTAFEDAKPESDDHEVICVRSRVVAAATKRSCVTMSSSQEEHSPPVKANQVEASRRARALIRPPGGPVGIDVVLNCPQLEQTRPGARRISSSIRLRHSTQP